MKRLFWAITFALISLTASAQEPCKGQTKAGQSCKSKFIVKGTGYCYAHDPKRSKCQGTTKAGKPCGQMPMKGAKNCRFHNS